MNDFRTNNQRGRGDFLDCYITEGRELEVRAAGKLAIVNRVAGIDVHMTIPIENELTEVTIGFAENGRQFRKPITDLIEPSL